MSSAGFSACVGCTAGKFTNSLGQSVCSNCQSGKFFSSLGATSCNNCGVGTYSNSGQPACTPCPSGKFSDTIETLVCSDCIPGSFSDTEGATECSPCLQSFYSRERGTITCSACPEGKITPGAGTSDPNTCFNPAVNFIQGYAIAAMLVPFSIEYVVYGRFHRLAFLRKERVILVRDYGQEWDHVLMLIELCLTWLSISLSLFSCHGIISRAPIEWCIGEPIPHGLLLLLSYPTIYNSTII